MVYLTGRDAAMRPGTLGALGALGFPLPDVDGVDLILKPRFDVPDLEFKTEALARVAAIGEVAGSFDNEPAHVNFFYAAAPKSKTVFLDTKHSGKPVVPHPEIPWIKNFLR